MKSASHRKDEQAAISDKSFNVHRRIYSVEENVMLIRTIFIKPVSARKK